MPGFNGRGPMGQGPMTGGGRGRCSGYANIGQGAAWGAPTAYGQGRGRGQGPCGGGRARGRGRGQGQGAMGPASQDLLAENQALRRRLAQLEARLNRQDVEASD
ncbi:MAG: DUF5320 domain-containing protein [Pseudomonadota bacterium]